MISLLMFNVDNERYLIGSILQDENVQREITALPDDLMHDDVNTKIFRTLKAMRREKKPIDIITVSNELQDSEYAAYIMRCARECPTTANYKQHIAHLLSLYERRTAYGLAQAFEQKLLSGDDLMACIGDLRSNLRHVKEPVSKLAHMSDVVTTTLDYIERKSKGEIVGMLTHIPDYDRFTGGLFKGNVTIIGARPAVGKSALGIEIAKNVAKHGGKVLVVSREMSDLQYGIRISSATSGINGMVLKNGTLGDNQWELLIDAMNELSTLPISFVFDIRNIEELNSFVVHEMDKDGVDLLVVDYLQLLGTSQKTDLRYQEVGAVSRGLKAIAMECKIPVIAMAQAGRSKEGHRSATCPVMSDLRESANIEQDADVIVFLHHPESDDDPEVKDNERDIRVMIEDQGRQYMILKFVKQRMGPTGKFAMDFDPSLMQFRCLERGIE